MLNIEEAFYEGDFGVDATEEILREFEKPIRRKRNFARMRTCWLEKFLGVLSSVPKSFRPMNRILEVVCLIGVNGSGKTTTCAKLGHQLKAQEIGCLGACDTFRAAATEQLKAWASALDLEIIAGHHGSDSAAVAFDAYDAAESRGCDYLIVDTAGRLH